MTPPRIWLDMVGNPLIIACFAGIALNLTGIAPIGVIKQALDMSGQVTIALGLLVVGAAIDITAFRHAGPATVTWSIIRLTGLPLVAVALGILLGLSEIELTVVAIATATPTAGGGYILVRQLEGDTTLSANLIAVQTIAAMLTIPIIFFLLYAFLK